MMNETELIDASIKGDRDSFGQIVRTYQSLICSITYNSIGDLHASEDLAQETFFSAWKNLKNLKEKSKFKYWLCGIARNLTNDYIRTRYSDTAYKSRSLETHENVPSTQLNPRQEAISKEEENILWQSLKEIPEAYREPLILYYRENQSIKMVADALDISEDAAKQRLSRGRNMLKEQVTAFVENTLQKSKPSETFAIAVITALPALLPQVTAAGIALTASKGSVAFKSAISFLLLGSILSPTLGYVWGNMGALVGLLGGIIGATASIRNAKSSRERDFLIKLTIVMTVWAILFIGVLYAVTHYLVHNVHNIVWLVSLIISILVYLTGNILLILWTIFRVKKIQIEDGTYIDPATWKKMAYQNFCKMSKGSIYGAFAGSIFGPVSWMISNSIIAHDWMTGIIVILVSVIIYLASVRYCIRRPERCYKILIWALFYVYLLTIAVVFLRWESWHLIEYGTRSSAMGFVSTKTILICCISAVYFTLILVFHLLDKKVSKLK
jgi:RNA polymerase sigma factor (sigma-70 family)